MAPGLARATLIRNPHYQRNGLKSYVHALKKWNIGPTVEGPYAMVAQVQQSGAQAILRKFGRKIGGKAHVKGHTLAKKDATSGQTGEVPAEDVESNALYLAEVSIGTPPQKMDLDFDTGSADLWVWSSKLPERTQQATSSDGQKHNIFNPSESSTYQQTNSTWQIQYGDGSTASGTVGTDTLHVGGIDVENQAIELADTLSSQFQQGPGDGLLGLAFGSINTVQPQPVKTPVENMISQQDIKKGQELFTCWLGDTTEDSFYTFGYIDQDALGGKEPTYTPIDNSQGFWMFDSTTAKVGDQTVDLRGNKAIADTGTTLALVSDQLCQAVYSAIPGAKVNNRQQGYVFPSNTDLSQLAAIQVAVGNTLFQINPEDLGFQDLGDGTTYGGIQSRGDNPFDILGDVFLRSVYAIFDQGGADDNVPRFGCVQRASHPQAGSVGAGSSA
ncbi:acid protease [Hortaea werneckii]|nr:acid protease [Hortaea werneckii]